MPNNYKGAVLNVFALAALVLQSPVVADEMPMARHGGTKLLAAADTAFRTGTDGALRIELPQPKRLETGGKGVPENRVGFSRRGDLERSPAGALEAQWRPVRGGYAATFIVRSPGAKRLRVGLRIGAADESIEIRVAAPAGHEEPALLDARWIRETYGERPELLWTPSTAGEAQRIEVFLASGAPPSAEAVRVRDVSHLFTDPFAVGPAGPDAEPAAPQAKLLACHQNFSCSTDPAVSGSGAAISKMIITGADGSSSVCTGSLLNDTGNVGRYYATAYHCVGTAAEASSLQYQWFFEQACGANTIAPAFTTTQGGQLLRADSQNDFTLLRVTGSIPPGVTKLGWSSSPLSDGTPAFGIHHPAGAPKALSIGVASGRGTRSAKLPNGDLLTVNARNIQWQSGITEPGSSGSPVMTGNGVFRGSLSMVPREQSCSAPRFGYYSDFSLAYPRVREWLNPAAAQADDYPDTAAQAASGAALDTAFLKVSLDSATDQDWFRFSFAEPGLWILFGMNEPGGAAVDTLARIYGADGVTQVAESDDAEGFGTHFGFFLRVNTPGTFYVRATGFAGAQGRFELVSLYDTNDDHSDLPFLGTSLAMGATLGGILETPGDGDYFVLDLPGGPVTIASSGSTDLVGALRNSAFQVVATNDDASAADRNFSISANVPAGRYFLQVVGYDVTTTGPYSVRAAASAAAPNYSALWGNSSEPGWGLNTSHQGDLVFATLFTYAPDGAGMWLVASNLARQPDGSFSGSLYRASGPPYYQTPWSAVSLAEVGGMTIRFASETAATLTYSFNGVTVNKAIERHAFDPAIPSCTSTTGSRAGATNYQDLWWNSSEPGWGLNLAHQGSLIFATLFTYNNAGRDAWLVASGLQRQPDGSFTGKLYVASGPPFNASPWPGVSLGEVGSMTLRFSAGDRGTLTYTVLGTNVVKPIERAVLGNAQPDCR